MACCFDDGTRFVAGLVVTPMLQYFDTTYDIGFLHEYLYPYLNGVVDFFISYAVWTPAEAQPHVPASARAHWSAHTRPASEANGTYNFPFTCAQEICMSGLNPAVAEHNGHQDLAYARMALAKLLEYTDAGPGGAPPLVNATSKQRTKWSHFLAHLAEYPLVAGSPGGASVFAEAATEGKQPEPSSNAGYPISHLAAIYPAKLFGRRVFAASAEAAASSEHSDSGESLDAVAWRTALLMNVASGFSPGNGFVLSWPPIARLVGSAGSEGDPHATSTALVANFSDAYRRISKPNGWPESGGGGLEQAGALDALHMMMVDVSMEGVVLLFPAWPAHPASFDSLRLSGALLLSASWGPTKRDGTSIDTVASGADGKISNSDVESNEYEVVSPVRLVSLAGQRVQILSPWRSKPVKFASVKAQSPTMAVYELPDRRPLKLQTVGPAGSEVWAFATSASTEYSIERTQ
jgi:hypothetical protein